MLLAVASWRTPRPSSAMRTSEPVTPVSAVSIPGSFPSSLDDEVGVQGAGRLDALQDRDHVARVRLDAGERAHQVGDSVARLDHPAALALRLLHFDAGLGHHRGAHARPGEAD